MFFNRLGELHDRSFENQRSRAGGLNLVVGRQISTKSAPTIADTRLCRLRSGSGDGDLADHLFLQIERLNDVTPAL